VKGGERERRSGHQVIVDFIPHIVVRSTVSGPKWPKVCRLTHFTEQSYGFFVWPVNCCFEWHGASKFANWEAVGVGRGDEQSCC
jgi:hypothetical protein